MASPNWSMTAIGYPAHRRSGARVVGLSHMSTHEVLRFAEALQLTTGWLRAEGSQPQLERMRPGEATWVQLSELFADRRVVMTDGLASGSLVFVAATGADGHPPADRPLTVWADDRRLPWVEVIDNEIAYWGGLDNAACDRLLGWFLAQRPVDSDWKTATVPAPVAARLRAGLFDHGWTRNLALARPGRSPVVELWGGVHASCILDHAGYVTPSRVNTGVRLTLVDGAWQAKDLGARSPLADETGKLAH